MASIIEGRALAEMPHPGDDLLAMDRLAHVVGVSVTTPRHWREVGIGPPRFRFGPSVGYQRAEVLRFFAGVESTENAGALVDPARTRLTACECAMTLLVGQTKPRPTTLERHPPDAAVGGSLHQHGEGPW